MADSGAPSPATDSAASTSGANETPQATEAAPQPQKKKFQQLQMPTYDEMMMQDMMNNCFVKSIISLGMGGAMGLAFGIFTSSMENAHGGGIEGLPVEENRPTRVVLREMFRNMRVKSVSYMKGFALMGMLYSGTECFIEQYRAKHDKMNPVYAGCVTGGLLAHSGGPQAMAIGCASFAAFSSAIEHFMESE